MKIGKLILCLILRAGNGRRFIERGDLHIVREHFVQLWNFWEMNGMGHATVEKFPEHHMYMTPTHQTGFLHLRLYLRVSAAASSLETSSISHSDSICYLGCLRKHQAGNLLLCCNPPAMMTLALHYLLLWSPSLPFPGGGGLYSS